MELTFVRTLDGFHGDARLYKLSEPYMPYRWAEESFADAIDYVVVSAVNAMFTGPETYIFAASADGEVTDWSELPGSFRGALDHDEAVRGFVERAT